MQNSIPIIPPRLDIFAIIIFLGLIQGIILSYFFLSRKKSPVVSNRLFGLILIALSAISFEIFLCYTGYIGKSLFLVDFSEPLNFTLGPLFYLYVFSKVSDKKNLHFRQYLHMLPFILYTLYSILFFIQGPAEKYNAYISAYYPEEPHLQSITTINPDPLLLKHYVNELFFLHLFIYSVMIVYLIFHAYKKEKIPFLSRTNIAHSWIRNFILLLLLMLIIIFVVKISSVKDLGDYIIASCSAVLIYSISFSIIGRSDFFSERVFSRIRKYEKSPLTEEMKQKILEKLKKVMEEEKPYLDYSFSLPSLARSIGASPHHLSQVLNESLNHNFFSYTATYRIEEAKRILSIPANINLMIEEIAEMVGYNSKSAFNNAFKKLTGMTPSQFKEMKTGKNPEK
jgi:AraC-like DNA-binding protein